MCWKCSLCFCSCCCEETPVDDAVIRSRDIDAGIAMEKEERNKEGFLSPQRKRWTKNHLAEDTLFLHGTNTPPMIINNKGLDPEFAREICTIIDENDEPISKEHKYILAFPIIEKLPPDYIDNSKLSGAIGHLWGKKRKFGLDDSGMNYFYCFNVKQSSKFYSKDADKYRVELKELPTRAEVAFRFKIPREDILAAYSYDKASGNYIKVPTPGLFG